jgi:uncharacterized NAD(P)/FAD-binding protein YdhS
VRHRSAPSVDGQVQELIMSGRLRVGAARVAGARAGQVGAGGAEVRILARGSGVETTLRVARVINCTGPATDCARMGSRLISQLLAEGLAVADPLGQGLATDNAGRLMRPSGIASENTWLIGPLARGVEWEITAVPELRQHAARVAEILGAGQRVAACGVRGR